MSNPFDVLSQIGNLPGIANNPTKKQYLDVLTDALRTGNSEKAEQLALNICKGYGVTREQAEQQARQFFGVK